MTNICVYETTKREDNYVCTTCIASLSLNSHTIKAIALLLAMPSVWPLSITQGPPQKANILLDTTCFSSADLDNLSDFESKSDTDTDSNVDSHYPFFDLANPTNMVKKEIQNAESHTEVF